MKVKRFIQLDCNGEEDIKRDYANYTYDNGEEVYTVTEYRDDVFYYEGEVSPEEFFDAWEEVKDLYGQH